MVVRELPVIFYTRTPEYVRGATGEIEAVAYESPAAEDETWDRPARPEWFYVVKFNMADSGTATPERPTTSSRPRFPNTGWKPRNRPRQTGPEEGIRIV